MNIKFQEIPDDFDKLFPPLKKEILENYCDVILNNLWDNILNSHEKYASDISDATKIPKEYFYECLQTLNRYGYVELAEVIHPVNDTAVVITKEGIKFIIKTSFVKERELADANHIIVKNTANITKFQKTWGKMLPIISTTVSIIALVVSIRALSKPKNELRSGASTDREQFNSKPMFDSVHVNSSLKEFPANNTK
jgi:hypothetical protein